MASSERTEAAQPSAASASTTTTSSSTPTATFTGAVSRGTGQRGDGEEGFANPSGTATAPRSALVDGVRCDLLMNARYHSSREAFLDTVHRVLMFLIIVMGAAAVTDLLNAPWVKGVFAAFAVVFAAFDLTADLSNRARCHALLKRRYFELLAELTAGRSAVEIEAHMHRLSAEEEPAFHALLAVSWNAAQEMVYGKFADEYKIPRRHKWLKNIRRYGMKYPVIVGPRPATA